MAQEPSSPGGSLGVKAVDEVQAMIQKSLELPKVKLLRRRMAEAGCAVKDNFFRAVVCQGRKGMAYFAPGHGIFVCSNHVRFQDEVNQLIIHELIHAYDDCRAVNLQWNNCAHQACSEIRAGHLSGDCHFMRELLRGHFKLRGHEPIYIPIDLHLSSVKSSSEALMSVLEEESCYLCFQTPIVLVQLPRIQWKMYGIFVTMTHSHLIKLLKKLHGLINFTNTIIKVIA
ncbi:hypothetical protein Ahy_A02g008323 isoform D [Arachis hypogaea]|uniref:Mitochondrial inner membrane protease ATP23 n=1 Tax=Arachis hypogaea TaxID=3818 RepID=A0A445EEE3_ARAHY|nr:hypothetical protein Ahy_A02g008323 isoform D [Arachis hypogaea]